MPPGCDPADIPGFHADDQPERTSDMYEQAIQFAMTVLRTARDWQDAQHALADHPRFGPWLTDTFGDGDIAEAQAIIREAEARLEDEAEDVDAMTHAYDRDLDADLSRRDSLREEAE